VAKARTVTVIAMAMAAVIRRLGGVEMRAVLVCEKAEAKEEEEEEEVKE
jgi:hypothetical protein